MHLGETLASLDQDIGGTVKMNLIPMEILGLECVWITTITVNCPNDATINNNNNMCC